MKGAAVELHHHTVLPPHCIDLEALDDDVELGLGKPETVEELEKCDLEVAADDPGTRVARLEDRSDRAAAGAARIAAKEVEE